MKRIGAAVGTMALALVVCSLNRISASTYPAANQMLVLWAWERPEDLRSINPQRVGIACLAETVVIRRSQVSIRKRRQPMFVPAGASVIAVVRIETSPDAQLGFIQRARVVKALIDAATISRVQALQIDFDARRSERDFYRSLVADVRQHLGRDYWISITALSSWCMYDNWISDLPVDEAVPMLFSLGAGRAETLMYLNSGRDFRSPLCRQSIGIRLGDDLGSVPRGRRVYMFSDAAWNASRVNQAEEVASRLR